MTTPADIIARHASVKVANPTAWADRIIAALDAAGFDIVARQPDTCPTPGAHEMAQTLAAWHDRGQR